MIHNARLIEEGTGIKVRPLDPAIAAIHDWPPGLADLAVQLELPNGRVLYALQDPEGNGPGSLFVEQHGLPYPVFVRPRPYRKEGP